MPDPTISDFISRMANAFLPEKATGIDATIQLKLTGGQPMDYFVIIKNSKCAVSAGDSPSAKLTVTADSDNFIKVFSGQMDAMQAFMQGKFKLVGDMNLAMKLIGLFKM